MSKGLKIYNSIPGLDNVSAATTLTVPSQRILPLTLNKFIPSSYRQVDSEGTLAFNVLDGLIYYSDGLVWRRLDSGPFSEAETVVTAGPTGLYATVNEALGSGASFVRVTGGLVTDANNLTNLTDDTLIYIDPGCTWVLSPPGGSINLPAGKTISFRGNGPSSRVEITVAPDALQGSFNGTTNETFNAYQLTFETSGCLVTPAVQTRIDRCEIICPNTNPAFIGISNAVEIVDTIVSNCVITSGGTFCTPFVGVCSVAGHKLQCSDLVFTGAVPYDTFYNVLGNQHCLSNALILQGGIIAVNGGSVQNITSGTSGNITVTVVTGGSPVSLTNVHCASLEIAGTGHVVTGLIADAFINFGSVTQSSFSNIKTTFISFTGGASTFARNKISNITLTIAPGYADTASVVDSEFTNVLFPSLNGDTIVLQGNRNIWNNVRIGSVTAITTLSLLGTGCMYTNICAKSIDGGAAVVCGGSRNTFMGVTSGGIGGTNGSIVVNGSNHQLSGIGTDTSVNVIDMTINGPNANMTNFYCSGAFSVASTCTQSQFSNGCLLSTCAIAGAQNEFSNIRIRATNTSMVFASTAINCVVTGCTIGTTAAGTGTVDGTAVGATQRPLAQGCLTEATIATARGVSTSNVLII